MSLPLLLCAFCTSVLPLSLSEVRPPELLDYTLEESGFEESGASDRAILIFILSIDLKTLDSRGRFGGGEAEAKAPVRGEPGVPASGAGAGKGSLNWNQALTFRAPASFTKVSPNGKDSYLIQGRGVQADLAAAHGPDSAVAAVANYPANIKSYRVVEETSVPSETSDLYGLKGPFSALNIDGSTERNRAFILADGREPIHEGYYSASEKAAIMADLDNRNYGTSIKKENRVFQSQILFEEFSKAAGGDVSSLRWVLRSDITNPVSGH